MILSTPVVRTTVLGFAAASVGLAQPAGTSSREAVAVSVLNPVVVTGSNIRRVEGEKALPTTILGADQMDFTGAQSIGDLLQSAPEFGASLSSIGATANGPNDAGGDTASANLRGLGDGNTLILLNGRRLSANGVAPGTPPVVFVNLNQIPVGAIDRVEILRDGASAIYGADATGGVVNIILKKNYTGSEVRARYGAASGGYDELTSSITIGRSFNGGRTDIGLLLSFYQRDGLFATDRVYAADADKRPLVGAPFSGNPALNGRGPSAPFGRYSRINTYNADGTINNSTSFFVQPATIGGGAEIVTGTGPVNAYNSQVATELIGDVKRYNALATFHHVFTPRLSMRGEASWYYARAHNQVAESPISGNTTLSGTDNVIVPASNYYNPYGARFNPAAPRDVLIRNYRPVELGPRILNTDTDSYRLLAVLEVRVGETWTWETGALYMESFTKDYQSGLISQSRFGAQLALNTPDAFNVFGGPNVNSQATLDKVRITDWTRGFGALTLLDAKATGDLFMFWGGPVAVAFGVEFREEQLRERNGPFGLADDVIAISGQVDVTARRDVYAGYVEVSVPVVGPKNRRKFLNRLEFTAAGRYENFSGFSATKPKFGAAVTTLPWLLFRASSGQGFRAPSVSELFQPTLGRRAAGFVDPARIYTANGVTIVPEDAASGVAKLFITGGNPRLQPESSRSWNVGTVIEPPFLKSLSFGVDYWGIRQQGRIDNPSVVNELGKDAALWRASHGANLNVVRAPRTADDVANGIPGILVSINGPYQNLLERDVQGLDLFGEYELRTANIGRFKFRAEASHYLKVRDIDANGVTTDRIRLNAYPRWRVTGGLNWSQASWSAGVFGRYGGDFVGPSAVVSNGTSWVIGSWTTFNVYTGYRFKRGWLHNTTVRVGANNVFDRDPPLDPSSTDGYNPGYANAIGRFVYLELRTKF